MTGSVQFNLFDDGASRVLGAGDYEGFRRGLLEFDCRRCGLWKGRTNLVVDRGNPRARIMLVGEGPGRNEDEEGRAFVGRAGQLLDRIMASIGLDTERDVLIANVVKCRPPGNRRPQTDEAVTCMPYLRRQIELVGPRSILLLGATAARYMLPDRSWGPMSREVGRFFTAGEYPGVSLMVLYHPAYLLRDPRRKNEMAKHVEIFRDWWVSIGEGGAGVSPQGSPQGDLPDLVADDRLRKRG